MKSKNLPKYNHLEIEEKWQKKWVEEKIFSPDIKNAKNPFYNLWMFPYPSAEGFTQATPLLQLALTFTAGL